jgi:hypothetical protein
MVLFPTSVIKLNLYKFIYHTVLYVAFSNNATKFLNYKYRDGTFPNHTVTKLNLYKFIIQYYV